MNCYGIGAGRVRPKSAQGSLLEVFARIPETKEDRDTLSKWGNDLRQTFRTIATSANVPEFDAKLPMNHAIRGANAGHVTRHTVLEDHLRSQQQAISSDVFAALGTSVTKTPALRDWLGRGTSPRAALGAGMMPTHLGRRAFKYSASRVTTTKAQSLR